MSLESFGVLQGPSLLGQGPASNTNDLTGAGGHPAHTMTGLHMVLCGAWL